MTNAHNIRPSNLPKLAECPNYQPKKEAGKAAERGTKLDTLFRGLMQGKTEFDHDVSEEDLAAVQWAVRSLNLLAGDAEVLTNEDDCRLSVPGIEKTGTADALIPDRKIGADLKSGSIRNYREQMSAYALACMEAHFAEEWTMYLLFCDQREVVEHRFEFDEAKALVESVIASASTEDPEPKECGYCGWCDRQTDCPATAKPEALALVGVEFKFEAILEDPKQLSEFLLKCDALDTFREKAKERAKELLAANPHSVPGWKLKKGAERQEVDHIQLGKYLSRIGSGPMLSVMGSMSAKSFRELWEKQLPHDPFPEDAVTKKPANKSSLTKA